MLEAIFTMLKAIFDAAVSIIEVLIESIVSLLDMLTRLPEYTEQMMAPVSVMPDYFVAAFAAAVGVTIVWMIIERGSSE